MQPPSDRRGRISLALVSVLGALGALLVSTRFMRPDAVVCQGALGGGWPLSFLCDTTAESPSISWNTIDDLEHTIDDIIAEGDKVAYRWTMRGTNRETGTQQTFRGHTFMRIVDGKIVEDWYTAETVTD